MWTKEDAVRREDAIIIAAWASRLPTRVPAARVRRASAASAFSGILIHCCVSVYLTNNGDSSSSFRLIAYLLVFLCFDCVC